MTDTWIHSEIHDRDQLELQCTHPLVDAGEDKEASAELELFVFIPRNVGANASNYSKDEFYGDLTAFVRLDVPDIQLSELGLDSPRSPLASVDRALAALANGEPSTNAVHVAVKLFGHSFAEAVHDRVSSIEERLAHPDPGDRAELLAEVDRIGQEARAALASLRAIRRRFEPFRKAAPRALAVLEQTDEYSSLCLDAEIAALAARARANLALIDGTGFVPRLVSCLEHHARVEAQYRNDRGFLTSPSATTGEYFAFRRSILKKSVQQALYIDTPRLSSDKFIRNTTGMVAAGLAATWAVVAQLPMQLRNLSSTAQTLVVLIPVIAYVAKDRIKELTREWLTRRLRASDHDRALGAESLVEAGLGTIAGRVRERMQFRQPADIDPDILAARSVGRTVRGAGLHGESVIVYQRRLTYHRPNGAPPLGAGMAMRQILRLNLREMLSRLDEPEQESKHYDARARRFVVHRVPKVYHLNIAARLTSSAHDPVVARTRLVINKGGIVRLERVV
jgi:hypothetical protein